MRRIAKIWLTPAPDEFESLVDRIAGPCASRATWTGEATAKITALAPIVPGDHDEAITRAHSDRVAAVIPGSPWAIPPGVSHFAVFQSPEQHTAAVRTIIDQ